MLFVMGDHENLYIGTCSWKYGSWKGLVYSKAKPANFLEEYSKKYNTVEVDQWFWSLFGNSVVLPKEDVVQKYVNSVPDAFKFGIKVPNSITLTHYYRKQKTDPLLPNPHFLSVDLMTQFLETIEPMREKLGPLMFQFEYLNKQKMKSLGEFLQRFAEFFNQLPKELHYAVEIRNPNYLNEPYFKFLQERGLSHVFLQGYYMPPFFEIFTKYKNLLTESPIIRLHGPNRADIEEITGENWGEIVDPRDNELDQLAQMISELHSRAFIYVNNHFEGSAPLTISRLIERLQYEI